MKLIILFLFFLMSSCALCAMPKECQKISPEFQRDFESLSKSKIPSKTKMLMIGSSSIQYWKNTSLYFKTLGQDEILNRGVGGTRVCHLIVYADYLFKNIKGLNNLDKLLIYSGDNDLGYGYSAQTIQTHYRYLVDLYRSKGLDIPIYIISTKPSPRRLVYLKTIQKLGELLQSNLHGHKQTYVLNRFDFYFNDDRSIKSELYRQDGIHLKPKVYWDWAWHLEKMWESY